MLVRFCEPSAYVSVGYCDKARESVGACRVGSVCLDGEMSCDSAGKITWNHGTRPPMGEKTSRAQTESLPAYKFF